MFYKAAPYIIYRGSDKKRAWKDFANYSIGEEKKVWMRFVSVSTNRLTGTAAIEL